MDVYESYYARVLPNVYREGPRLRTSQICTLYIEHPHNALATDLEHMHKVGIHMMNRPSITMVRLLWSHTIITPPKT